MIDGVLTDVDQSTDSEIAGVLLIPANIISGYTSALGNILGGLNIAKQDRSTALANQESYLLAQSKLRTCQIVVAANDLSTVTPLGQAAAIAAIKAACQ